jgi:hypothetical protein
MLKKKSQKKRLIEFMLSVLAVIITIFTWLFTGTLNIESLKTSNPAETRLMLYRESQYRTKSMKIEKHQQLILLSNI